MDGQAKNEGGKMKKGIIKSVIAIAAIITSIILIALALSACGNNSNFPTSDVVATQSTEIKLTDGLGKAVVLDKPAEKILVFAPSALEIIDGLNAMNTVIGVDNWSVDNKEPLAKGLSLIHI